MECPCKIPTSPPFVGLMTDTATPMKTASFLLPLAILAAWTSTAFAQPVITSQPQSQTVILYQPAAFRVIASGTSPLSYQWRKDGVPIAGATNDEIVLAHAQFSDTGRYSVVVEARSKTKKSDSRCQVGAPPQLRILEQRHHT